MRNKAAKSASSFKQSFEKSFSVPETAPAKTCNHFSLRSQLACPPFNAPKFMRDLFQKVQPYLRRGSNRNRNFGKIVSETSHSTAYSGLYFTTVPMQPFYRSPTSIVIFIQLLRRYVRVFVGELVLGSVPKLLEFTPFKCELFFHFRQKLMKRDSNWSWFHDDLLFFLPHLFRDGNVSKLKCF